MPGRAGGGHSGSVGGGSRGGGFSGGSHHTGRVGGSRSPGFSGNRGYSGGYRPVYRRHYRGGGYSNSGSGCLSSVTAAVIAPLLIAFFVIIVIVGILTNTRSDVQRGMESFTGEIVSETVRRAKLDASLCTPMEKTVETDLPDELNEVGAAKVAAAIQTFYDATGVQPYFLLLSGIEGDPDPDDSAVDSFLFNKYVDTFGSDEGHIILLMLLDEEYQYHTWYICGDDAVNVTDDAACETILDHIDAYFLYENDTAEVISKAFTVSAQEIMNSLEYYYYDTNGNLISEEEALYAPVENGGIKPAVGLILLPGLFIAIFLTVRALKKKKTTPAAPSDPLAEPSSYKQVNAQYGAPKPQQTYMDRLVTCPNCGATAYPKSDGTCDYCGSRIV